MRHRASKYAFVALLSLAAAMPAGAQSRDAPRGGGGSASGDGAGNGNGTTLGGRGPGTSGLPDAVTVLEILRHLPRRPSDVDDTSGRPDGDPPRPLSGGEAPPLRRPSRVVTLNPAQPFAPRIAPRGSGAAAAIVGTPVTQIRPREVLVSLAADAGDDAVDRLSQDLALDGDTLYRSLLLGTRVVRFRIIDQRSVGDVVQQLAADARVQVVQPNYLFVANGAGAQSLPIPQYAPKALDLSEAHRIALGRRVKVAVIDTAIDTAHPVFAGAVTATFDALGAKGAAELHGTSIASIVGAREAMEGVAPDASLLGVRAFAAGEDGIAQSYSLAIIKGLDWAVLNGARVINMSFAGPEDPLLGAAIASAAKRGVTIVAAAGNNGPEAPPAYPGAFPGVIAVTATDDHGALYRDANRGAYISVAAPGVDIVGAAPQGAYEISSGTSMAAAHVSGIIALMLEKYPKLTPAEIKAALTKSAAGARGGAGVANALRALNAL